MASEGSNEKREGERVGSALRLKLKYTDVDTFVEKFATNISKGGVFIASRTPKPVGTPLRFELTLENGQRLIKGEGTVSWVKEFDPKQPTKAHGMGLKFTKLDSESRVLVDRMLAIKQRREDARAAAGEGPVTAVTPELTPVLAQPSPAKKPGPPPLPAPVVTARTPAVDYDGNDPTRADAAPMTIMMDVGTSGVAVRRDLPSKAVPPPLPPKPAPPPLSKGAAAATSLTTVTGGWDAASRTAQSPLPDPPPLAPPLPEPATAEPIKTNGAHTEHADFDDATRDDPTLLVTLPEFAQPAAAPAPAPPAIAPVTPSAYAPAAPSGFAPAAPSATTLPMPPLRLPDPVVAGDVEALLAHADRELAELAVDPVALEQAGRRAHELSAGVDIDTLLAPEPPPAATLAEATRALR